MTQPNSVLSNQHQPGHRPPATGHRTPATGHRPPDTGHRTPDTGHRTPDTGIANTIRRSSTIMLATIALLAMSLSGLHAQSNSEYNFLQQYVTDYASYGGSTPDSVPVLTMDCIAANGIGQWTLTSTSNPPYEAGWYLLENALRQPSTKFDASDVADHPGCIPPGVVAHGQLQITTSPIETKATANMDGSVSFVCPDRSGLYHGTQFILQGFVPSDIDISLTGIPNPAPTRQIVKTVNTPYTEANIWYASTMDAGGLYHDVVGAADEADYRDRFDVKSDGGLLYIAWCSKVNSPTPGVPEIYVTVLDAVTKVPLLHYPRDMGPGIRPTLSVNPRNNRGSHVPVFDLGWIYNGAIQWVRRDDVHGTTITWTASPTFMNPSDGTITTYTAALHVCALVNSVEGSSTLLPELYAIVKVNEDGNKALLLYNNNNPHLPMGVAAYVDGILMPPTKIGTFFTPIPAPPSYPNPPGWPVKDAPITAFANPYDNQDNPSETPADWREYNQYHCLYQSDLSSSMSQPPSMVAPLLIVRGSDNGALYPNSFDPNYLPPHTTTYNSPDMRLALNVIPMTPPELLPDPSTYVAAVNQMGIHVHFRIGNTHYYARDLNRTFDEDIIENTLVTDQCYVENGTWHGGSVGATILPGNRMTVWTDPNYGQKDNDVHSGLYQPSPDVSSTSYNGAFPGTLCFGGALYVAPISYPSITTYGVILNVGNGDGPATLAVMPNFRFLFDQGSDFYSSQGVTVQALSTFDYYGLANSYSSDDPATWTPTLTPVYEYSSVPLSLDGAGSITLQGSSTEEPADLVVHPGADFHILEDNFFTSTYGNIQVLYGHNVFPAISTASGSTNPQLPGVLTFEGLSTLTNTTTTGYFPAYSWSGSPAQNYIIHVPASSTGDAPDETGDSPNQFVSSYSTYSNSPASGLSEIRFDNKTLGIGGPYRNCSFDHDVLNSVEITAMDPQNTFSITNSTFGGTSERAISFVRSALTTYGNIDIEGNTFNDAANSALDDIYFNGFNTQPISNITVSDNSLIAGFHDSDAAFTAIRFEQTDGAIVGNTATGGFLTGIVDIGDEISPKSDASFICSNNITKSSSNSPAAGMYTSYYTGYVKLNSLSYASTHGYEHALDGPPHLIANTIYDNASAGIIVAGTVDMSGVHHGGVSGGIWSIDNPGSGDVGAYNSVYNNSSSTSPDAAQIYFTSSLADLYLAQTITSHWTASGENNIFAGTSSASSLIIGPNAHRLDGSNNWWGSGVIVVAGGYVAPWPSFGYSLDLGTPFPNQLSGASSSSGVECGGGYLTEDKHNQGVLQIDTQDSCWGLNDNCEYYTSQRLYDSAYCIISYYIMHCYGQADPERTLVNDLSSASGSTQLSTEAGRLQYRTWILDTVINLRHDDGWFCYSVSALTSAYDNYGSNVPAALAILKFLIDNPRCSAYVSDFGQRYDHGRKNQIAIWQDTAKNNNLKYFDSTLPSFHMLGLDTLLNFASVHYYEASGPQIITDASITANPFQGETSLSLATNREAYLHIDVLDLLGRKIEGAGYDGVFEPGKRTIPLKMGSVASGSYYLRISTANNELRTLKMVKQE